MNKETIVSQIWDFYEDKSTAFFRAIEISVVRECIDTQHYRTVLDIGPGDGFLSRIVFDNDQYIIGVDNDEAGLTDDGLKKKFINELHLGDAREPWNFSGDHKFDVIFSNSVLEHIPSVDKVIERCGELKYDHDVIFTVPNNNFTNNLVSSFLIKIPIIGSLFSLFAKKRARMLNHYNDMSSIWWVKRFEKQGYKLHFTASYLTPSQLQRWNLNAILNRLFSFNIIKQDEAVIKQRNDSKNSCMLLVFQKRL